MLLLRIGLIIKAFDALFEIAGGILLFFPQHANRLITFICQHELIRHAKPHLVHAVQSKASEAVSDLSVAAAVYLIAHGILKIVFIGGALAEKTWGYIGLIFILVVFTALELGRALAGGGGWPIFLFAAFDGYLAYLVWREFARERPEEKREVKRAVKNIKRTLKRATSGGER